MISQKLRLTFLFSFIRSLEFCLRIDQFILCPGHRHMARGVQGGRRWPQAGRLVGGLPLKQPQGCKTVSGVARPQGIERLGMADPSDSPWPPLAIRPWSQVQKCSLYLLPPLSEGVLLSNSVEET
jgi:hypothetical protein